MIIQIDDKPYLIWLPKHQPKDVAGPNDPTNYGFLLSDRSEVEVVDEWIVDNSEHQTGDIYKTDCNICFDWHWPFDKSDCPGCKGLEQIKYKIDKP